MVGAVCENVPRYMLLLVSTTDGGVSIGRGEDPETDTSIDIGSNNLRIEINKHRYNICEYKGLGTSFWSHHEGHVIEI